MYIFEHSQILKADSGTLIDFFSDVSKLDGNTPWFFRLQLLEGRPGGQLEKGQRFRYKFRLFGIPFPWTTLIDEVEEDYFVDSQEQGVYKSFRHIHAFLPRGEATLMLDKIAYELPFGPLNPIVNTLAVRPILSAIFSFRAARAAERFGEVRL